VGYHYQQADKSEKAFEYQLRAAKYEISRCYYREGLVLLTSASQINDTLEDLLLIATEIKETVLALEILCFGNNKNSRLYKKTSRYYNTLVAGNHQNHHDPHWNLERYMEFQSIVDELIEARKPIPVTPGCGLHMCTMS